MSPAAPEGQHPPKAAEAAASPRSAAKVAMAIAAVLLLGALAAVVARPAPEPPQPPSPQRLQVVEEPVAVPPLHPATLTAADAGLQPLAPAAVAAPESAPSAEPEPPLKAELAQELDEAEDALEMGDFSQATSHANHVLLAQKSSRAQALLARIACRRGEAEKARAAFEQVGAADRADVLRECRQRGIEFR